ncbi:MAG: glycosyltransferase [Saprospiraceae bacterium]
MRVLYVTNMYPGPDHPVYGVFVKEQIDGLTEAAAFEHDVYYIDSRRRGARAYLRSLLEVPRMIRKNGYDLVHIHYGLAGLWRLLYTPPCPVFLSLHGADILAEQGKTTQVALTKRLLPLVDRVFTLSAAMEKVVSAHTNRYERLPCGVNTDFFRPGPTPLTTPEDKLLVFPGPPAVEVKNFPLFEQTIHLVRRATGLRIEYACLEKLSRAGVRDLFQRADCLLMTSISEGSPQSVKEALSCGLPVVAVDVGDVREMLTGIPHCHVTAGRTATELADRVVQTFGFQRTAVRAAFLARGIYDQQSIARRWAALYGLKVRERNFAVP